jgi:hypothetical protein
MRMGWKKRPRGGWEIEGLDEQIILFTALVLLLLLSGYFLFEKAQRARFDAERSNAVDLIMAEASLISVPAPNECIQDPPLHMSPDFILKLSLDHEACLAYARMLKAPACLDADKIVPVHFNLMFLPKKPSTFYPIMMNKVRAVLYALFATQQRIKMSVIIWTNDPLRLATFLGGLDQEDGGKLGSLVHIKMWNATEYVVDTPFAHGLTRQNLHLNDPKNWRGGDLMRLIVLYKFGGFYIDLDIVMLQDLAPLMTRDFVEQWSCFADQMNGAIMYAKTPKSPLLKALVRTYTPSAGKLMPRSDTSLPLFQTLLFRSKIVLVNLHGVEIFSLLFLSIKRNCDSKQFQTVFSIHSGHSTTNAPWQRAYMRALLLRICF